MTEEDGKIEDNNKFEKWMYDFAWEVQKDAQAGINRLDNKALNIMNIASILIPIITGIFFYSKEKHIETILTFMNVNLNSNILLLGSIAFLILTILFSFIVIWPRKHGTIPGREHFEKIDRLIMDCNHDDVSFAFGATAREVVKWQNKLLDVNKNKGFYLRLCSYSFVTALLLIFLSATVIFLM
ncbi:MAG: hypothetical protein C5S44_08980 [Candidatus Methanocomedens sp.]|nr:MAG: hypothetical protein C5S44_08980 [ANME-2 cluster archaeon]